MARAIVARGRASGLGHDDSGHDDSGHDDSGHDDSGHDAGIGSGNT
jgi:hypothetical protein